MSLLNATLLAICLLSAVVCDASALTKNNPDKAKISSLNEGHTNTSLEERLLMANDANNADSKGDVEKSFISGPIAEAMSKISPSTQKLANKLWLQSKTDPALVFAMLHLGEAAGKLDDNPRLLLWLNYVDMYANLKYCCSFSVDKIYWLLQKSYTEEKLVSLFQSLRRIPARKSLAEQMQIRLFVNSPSSHKLLNAAWLKSGESPAEVFRMLHLDRTRLPDRKLQDNSKFLQWFKYTEIYWPTGGRDLRTFIFLQKHYGDSGYQLALLFQALKQRTGFGSFGDNLQTFLFKSWADKNFTPEFIRSQLSLSVRGDHRFKLDKDDVVFYRALEEYTIYFTSIRGDKEVLKTVRGLFAHDNADEALDIATNLARKK